MYRAIGTKHVEMNTIRTNLDTQSQERFETPKIEELPLLGDKQGNSKEEGHSEASMKHINEIPIEKASSPYEVIQIKTEDRLMSAVIIYDTGLDVSLCNYETVPIVTIAKEEKEKMAIRTINSVQTRLVQVCKLNLKNNQTIEALTIPRSLSNNHKPYLTIGRV